jgi:hypothetical protein
VSAFPKTRAAADYAARRVRTEPARTRAAILLERLSACEAPMASGNGEPPVIAAGLLRGLVLAVAGLASRPWLEASGDDPAVAAFTTMRATAGPPDPATIDEICSRVLRTRFPPAGATRRATSDEDAGSG